MLIEFFIKFVLTNSSSECNDIVGCIFKRKRGVYMFDTVMDLLENKKYAELRHFLTVMHPVDIGALMEELPSEAVMSGSS